MYVQRWAVVGVAGLARGYFAKGDDSGLANPFLILARHAGRSCAPIDPMDVTRSAEPARPHRRYQTRIFGVCCTATRLGFDATLSVQRQSKNTVGRSSGKMNTRAEQFGLIVEDASGKRTIVSLDSQKKVFGRLPPPRNNVQLRRRALAMGGSRSRTSPGSTKVSPRKRQDSVYCVATSTRLKLNWKRAK